MDTFVP